VETLVALRAHVASVRALVICPLPLGSGNVAALDVALDARRGGTPVLLFEPDGERSEFDVTGECTDDERGSERRAHLEAVAARDFSGQGVSAYRALLAAGASHAGSIRALLALLSAAGVGANRA
jgi:hypothetical protein